MRFFALIFLILSCSVELNAQAEYTIDNELEKNNNVLAENLIQNLSVSRDSLVLENDRLFSKVEFYNDTFRKAFYFKPAVKVGMISLNELPLGSYTVMFYQSDMTIVFRINRKAKFENTMEALATEMSSEDLANDNTIDIASTTNGPVIFDDEQTKLTRKSKKDKLNADYQKKNFSGQALNKTLFLEEEGMYPYDLTNTKRDHVQTREDYRRTHLRPNGKPYD